MTPTCFSQVIPVVRLFVFMTLLSGEAHAQGITVDGRLSPAQALAGPNYAISAGLGRQVGANLFHSFGVFGLKAGETATFSGPAGVGNVIGRVTGGAASSINGGINSTIPGANLYLINPSGVVFGPNASVDVGGSFHASSADYLRMGDGARFQATNPEASTLSAAPPEAFGFLSASPQPVAVNGSSLQLKQGGSTLGGSTLGLVGGDVTISGGVLVAPGGTVHVASAAGPGEVPVDPRAGPAPTVARSGRVQVVNGSTIYPSGGSVFIRAGELVVSNSTIVTDDKIPGQVPGQNGVLSLHADRAVTISNRANVVASAGGPGRGPGISIGTAAGGTVTVDSARTTIATNAGAPGEGGPVAISTGTLTLRNGAVVVSNATDRGNGGPISVAADSVLLDGLGTRIESQTRGVGLADANGAPAPAGTGGTISLTGGTLTVRNVALVEANTFGNGKAGSVNVAMAGTVAVTDGAQVMSNSNTGPVTGTAATTKAGDAGTITLNAGVLTLVRGGTINSDTSGPGNAGGIALAVGGALTVDGANRGDFTNAVRSQAIIGVSGSTGPVQVTAGSVWVLNGGFISSDTFGTGRGGPVTVTTPGALLLDGRFTQIGASAQGLQSGDAGPVTVHASTVTIQNGAQIASATKGAGQGGSVTVNTGTLILAHGGTITSDTFGSGNGGEIALTVDGTLTIDGANKGIFDNGVSSRAGVGVSGSAGPVQVVAGSVSVLNGGFISSDTFGTGRGGPVTVTTPGALLLDGGGVGGFTQIGASAQEPYSGDAGPVTVKAGTATIRNGAQIASLTNGTGRGGDVTVNTGALSLVRGGLITSDTFGSGNAGQIALTIDGALTVDGMGAGSLRNGVSSEAAVNQPGVVNVSGSAGSVQVSAGSVSVLNGGFIDSNTISTGAGGPVTVTTPGALLLDGAGGGSTEIAASALGPQSGDGGPVSISAGTVVVQNGARVASATDGAGRGGSVTVKSGAVTLARGGTINSATFGSGNAGEVTVDVGGPLLLDGRGDARTAISAATSGPRSGAAGLVTVRAGTVTVQGRAQVASSTTGPGQGGNVDVAATSAIRLNGPGPQVNATATGTGNAGSISVAAPQVLLQGGASVSTAAQAANGGSITIGPGDLLYLRQSAITTSVKGVSGNGGNILTQPRLVLLDRSTIQANAVGGNGGNVRVEAEQLVPSFDSAVTASSQRGVSGAILVSAQPLNLNGSLVVLAGELRAAAALLREGCAVRGASPRSSLVAAGRGGQRQGLEASVPALYFARRPVPDGAAAQASAADAPAAPQRISFGLSSACG